MILGYYFITVPRDFALSKRKDAMQKYNDWIEDAIGEYSVIKKCIQM